MPDSISEYGILTLKSIVSYMKDTNEKDLDKEKLDKYVNIKAKYDSLLNSYSSDVEDTNKIIKSFNSYYVFVSVALLTFTMYIVLKKRVRI